jgi:uncharacterized protein (DUF433 family)
MTLASARRFTPQEAAALTGVRLQHLQNALTKRRPVGSCLGADGRRGIDLPTMMAFAAAERMPNIRVAPETLDRAFRRTDGFPNATVEIDGVVTIDAPRLLAPILRNIELYDRARSLVTHDPAVMGGMPVIKGTRIPARTLLARLEGGDSMEMILEDYPYLDPETVEAAALYARANPMRGRPRADGEPAPDHTST